MYQSIEEYLDALKNEMKDADPALVQDAQADAREHLTLALKASKDKEPDVPEADALNAIIDGYGSPDETASAYREVERVHPRCLIQQSNKGRFLGISLAYTQIRVPGVRCFI